MASLLLSPEEKDLIQVVQQEFDRRLQSYVPQMKHRHFTEFFEEDSMKELARLETAQVSQELVEYCYEQGFEPNRIDVLVNELCSEIKKLVDKCIAKNRNCKKKCESFFKNKIDHLSEDFNSFMAAKLLLNPKMDMKSLKELLKNAEMRTMGYFENWNLGDEVFFEEQKGKLQEKLNQVREEMLGKQELYLKRQCLKTVEMDISTRDTPEEQDEFNGSISEANEAMENEHDDNQLQFEPNADAGNAASSILQLDLDSASSSSSVILPELESRGAKRAVATVRVPHRKNAKRSKLISESESIESSSEDSSIVTITATTDTEEEHPLIFRLASQRISMGTKLGDSFVKLRKCGNEKLCIPPVLAVDENGNLLYGADALMIEENFSLEQYIGESMSVVKKTISFKINGEEVTREVTIPFLLGLILGKLKKSAEAFLNRNFHSAIVLVPLWFCSLHRLHVKDAARIAGFAETKLINQESLAAYAKTLKGRQPESFSKSRVLVLSETFGVVSGIFYSNSSRNDESMHMDGTEFRRIKKNDHLERKRRHLVAHIAFSRNRHCSVNVEESVVFVTESSDWMQSFKKIADLSEYSYDNSKASPSPSSSDLFGASLLAERNIDQLVDIIEHLPNRLRPCRYDRYKKDYKELTPIKASYPKQFLSKLPMKDFQFGVNIQMHQENVRNAEMVTIGRIEFKGVSKYTEDFVKKAFLNCELSVMIRVSGEGIVSLEKIDVKKLVKKRNAPEILPSDDFAWVPATLSDIEREAMMQLVNSILGSNEGP